MEAYQRAPRCPVGTCSRFKLLAISRQVAPCARSRRMRSRTLLVTAVGRPSLTPWARLMASPCLVFSPISLRSNSASAARMVAISSPAGVVRSIPRSARTSCQPSRRERRNRPERSWTERRRRSRRGTTMLEASPA